MVLARLVLPLPVGPEQIAIHPFRTVMVRFVSNGEFDDAYWIVTLSRLIAGDACADVSSLVSVVCL